MTPHRFVVLDGFRGLAALAVVLYHIGTATGAPWLAPRGYLAVDFFFVLSGFVLAHAYERRLAGHSLTPLGFYRVRFRRLWPMAFAGTVVGAILLGKPNGPTAIAFVFAAVMLPDLMPGAVAFPLNPPHWSIFLELAANYVYAIIAPHLSNRRLLILVVCSALWLAIDTIAAGNANHIAAVRVAFGFFAGVGIYRAWCAGLRVHASPVLLSILLVACLAVPGNGAIDVLAQLAAFPFVVWAGASSIVGPGLARSCRLAGRASYPLYALHYPILVALLG